MTTTVQNPQSKIRNPRHDQSPGCYRPTNLWWVYGDDADQRQRVEADSMTAAEIKGGKKLGIPADQVIARYIKTINVWVPSEKSEPQMNTDAHRSDAALSADEAETIRHSLGLTRTPTPHRNCFCAESGDPKLEALVGKGLMRRGHSINDGRDRYYFVTETGAATVGAKLPTA